MPTYNGRCDEHGEFEDLMKASEYIKAGGLFCPICKKKATTLIRKAPAIIGPLPSKTLEIDQIGQNFSSPEEKKAYFSRRKDRAIVSKNDSRWTEHYDAVRNQADRTAKSQGFRDHEDKKGYLTREKRHKKAVAQGDKRIQISTS